MTECVIYGCDREATTDTRYGEMCEMDAADLPVVYPENGGNTDR